ncbi:MAG: hypothetical protein LBE71_03150 [Dysgonamonadaceae bacterium]|jgi:hypothetical protein|nr:hypothetical protein [Dysgonamonadaceae bacterium]
MKIPPLLLFILLLFCLATTRAQKSPLEIKYKAWGLHALRHYPFSQKADDIAAKLIAQDSSAFNTPKPYYFRKTALDLVINAQFMEENLKYIHKYYGSWLKHGHSNNKSSDRNMTLFLAQEYKDSISTENIFDFIDSENLSYLLDEWTGDIDLAKDKNEALSVFIKSPLAKNAMKTYHYYLSGIEKIESIPVYEIAFFSKKQVDNTFEGYLYVSIKDFSLVKAVFTVNYFARHKGVNEMLFTHTPEKKENLFYLGNDGKAGLLLNKTEIPTYQTGDSLLTPSEEKIASLIEEASHTRAYRNMQKTAILLLTDKTGIVGDKLEIGPLSHTIHYNELEGLRLRIGGNTTKKLNRHFSAGGYLAYGFRDRTPKYRGDIGYSYNRNNQLRFTYVRDLNLPGYDLLKDERDQIFYSFSHSGTKSMSLQKIGQVKYEKNILRYFSAESGVKYIYDNPLGEIRSYKNAELNFSLRYAPCEKFIKLRSSRFIFQNADFDVNIHYRKGIKGVFDSYYNYSITSFSLYKKIYFPFRAGHTDIHLSGGKVWNRIPFPILFIPAGNQGYIFDKEDYNLMNYYEFVTDRYLSCNLGLTFNLSPIKIIYPKSKIRTNLGLKTIYGPLSDNNNPRLHPELFPFGNGISTLGNIPYTEINIGLDNIFGLLRIDYVRRLHHRSRQSIFFSIKYFAT